jgi:hypothetical protein
MAAACMGPFFSGRSHAEGRYSEAISLQPLKWNDQGREGGPHLFHRDAGMAGLIPLTAPSSHGIPLSMTSPSVKSSIESLSPGPAHTWDGSSLPDTDPRFGRDMTPIRGDQCLPIKSRESASWEACASGFCGVTPADTAFFPGALQGGVPRKIRPICASTGARGDTGRREGHLHHSLEKGWQSGNRVPLDREILRPVPRGFSSLPSPGEPSFPIASLERSPRVVPTPPCSFTLYERRPCPRENPFVLQCYRRPGNFNLIGKNSG